MDLINSGIMLAQGPSPTQQNPTAQMLSTVGMLVIMVVMFYFVLIRPQSKKAKEHAEMLKTIKAGDKIVTSGGIVGAVVSVKDRTLSIRSGDAKFEIAKSAITEITERSGEAKES